KKLYNLSEDLRSRERNFGNLTPRIEAAERELEEMCRRTQELLQQEYHTLQTLIEQNQQQAFFILNAQKQTMKRQLHQLLEDTQNYQSKSTAMTENIKQLSSRRESESPVSLLGEINAFETSLHTMNVFYSSVEKKLKVDDTRLKALENSVKKIVEKNKELLPRPWEFSETITLDESKRQEYVQISEDKTEMSRCPSDNLSLTARSSWINQQATQSFSKGPHYWEVDVGGCESWQVGIVEQSEGKGIQISALSQERSSWVLECDGGELSALHNNEFSRIKESNLQTLGMFLDCDKKRLKFYNVNTGCIMHSFFVKFKHSVCPVFSMRPQKDSIARLKICNLIHHDDRQSDSALYSEISETKKLNDLSGNLTSRERKFADLTPRIAAAERELEEMCSRTQELLQQEYHTLQTLLVQNQQQAFFILNAQKQTIKRQLHQLLEDTQNYQSKSTAITEDIKQLNSRQESENPASLLGEINTIKTSLHTMNEFYSSVEKKLKVDDTRIKALENSVKKIVEKNKELLPRPWEFSEKITLDESKEEENLQISEDKTEMSVCPSDNLSHTFRSSWINQQASQSFSKGPHYWEVDVGGCESWQVGIVEQSQGKGIHILALSQERNSWVLECDGGELSALHNNEFSRIKESNVQTLGVFLDCDKGQLKFYNVNTGCIMHSFTAKFKHSVCPVFSMRPQKDSMARLKICNLLEHDDSTLDSKTYETKKLDDLSGNLTSRERKFGNLTPRIATAERELEEMCGRTQELLQQEYHTLQTLLEQNQQQAFFILNAQKQSIKRQFHQLLEDTQNYQSKSTVMTENIKQLSSRQESESPASLLGEITTIKTNLHTINEFYSSVEKKLEVDDTRIKALENSIKKIVEKNKELLPRPWEFSETITLDKSKREKYVQISGDKTEMSVCTSDHLGHTSRLSWINQEASQSFSKGPHYWEVDVGGCESWQVGVVEQSQSKGIHILALSQERSSWVLECDGGELSALHNNEFSRIKESNVQTLGVFLDCDNGQLKFYNVNTGCIMHSFIAKFKHSVCPVFSMRPQKDSMARLKICNLLDHDDSTLDSNTYETLCLMYHRKKLHKHSEDVRSRERKFGDLTPRIEAAERELEEMCSRTQELLQQEYHTLQTLLEQNQQQAFFILNAQKQTIKRQLHQLLEDTQNYQSKSTAITEDIKQLSSRQESENPASLLGEISTFETSLHTINEFYSSVEKKLKVDDTRIKALENSVKKIVEKNKELLPRPWEFSETITLDESKTDGYVQISEDKTEVSVCRLDNLGHTSRLSWINQLASQSFSKGPHYWEVDVGGCESWQVGIMEQSQSKGIHISALAQERNSWVLECDGGELSALHNNEFSRIKESNVQTLGVFLDCDNGQLKFYNVNTGCIMHSFTAKFKHSVCPVFSMRPQKDSMARLKICNLLDHDDSTLDSNTSETKKLHKLSEDLRSRERKFGDLTPRIEAAERELEEMCSRTQELLQQEYHTLQTLLEQNQQQAFFILNAQKQTIKRQLHQLLEDTQNYQSKSTAITEDIKQLSSRQESENPASLLGEINAFETSLHTMNEFYSSVEKKLKVDDTRIKALENSVKKIVEKNKELLPRPWEFLETITLDDSKMQKYVQISEGKTEMSVCPPDNSHTACSTWINMQASQSFSKGLHYWEVYVGGCEIWQVGVVEQSLGKGIQSSALSQEKSSWVLESDGDELSALHSNNFSRVKESNVQTLGVFLDYDNGRLKFYNVNTGSIMYSFIAKFKHSVYPVFSIRPQKDSIARLKICNLIDHDDKESESTLGPENSET
ncbi:E3 ubiquitin-protein ligase TRIM39-like, partial [Clarias magur]